MVKSGGPKQSKLYFIFTSIYLYKYYLKEKIYNFSVTYDLKKMHYFFEV